MTSSTLLPPPTATAEPAAALRAAPTPLLSEVARGLVGGLFWTYNRGTERILTNFPAAAWEQPEAQPNWRRVKQNPRREVWRAEIEGRAYYLKYYFASWRRRLVTRLFRRGACAAEWEGGLYAARAGIPAVRPIAYARLLRDGRHSAVLITEAVEPAQPLDEFWLQLQTDENTQRRRSDTTQIIELLAQMIARAHQSGFEHLDMHVANVLVQPLSPRRYRTVFIDLHSARRGVPISDRAVVRNLAQLNQWFRRHSTIGDRLRFLRAYLRWRDEYEHAFVHGRALSLSFAELTTALLSAARRHAHRLGTKRDHRALRDGRYFIRLRLPGGWRGIAITRCKHARAESRASALVFERTWWQAQLADPLRWFATELTVESRAGTLRSAVCKDSHSALVGRALLEHESGPLPVIIKRPRARNWQRRLAQLWPPSRSLRGWRMGHALLHRDVRTARPLAVLERRCGPLVLDNLLITEAIPGAVDLESFLRKEHAAQTPVAWLRLKRAMGGLLAAHVRRLLERGFEHRDCKASNVLVVKYPTLKLLWIDMDGLRTIEGQSPADPLRPLVRLHVSLRSVPGLTRTDRVRFLQAYLARFGSPPDAWRRAWEVLAPAIQQKIAAYEARRQWKLKHYGRA